MNRLLKIINKKISLGVCVSVAFIFAALAYSISYNIAMHKFNEVVSYNYEKQKMYSKLSEVDHAIRQEYIGNIDEADLINNICDGYIQGLNDVDCEYFSGDEYKEYVAKQVKLDEPIKTSVIDDVGYLKILSLNGDAADLFISSFQSLQSDDIHKITIDIRGLDGGDSTQLAKIINFLFPSGDIVNYVEKDGTKGVEFKSTSTGVDCNMSLICDKNTSGISEILASAMKDFGKAKVVGERTKGKALKTKTLQLSDGSVLIFPTAHYLTKDGNSLYGMGVIPDVESSLDEEKVKLLNNGQLGFDDDNQLLAAIDSLD